MRTKPSVVAAHRFAGGIFLIFACCWGCNFELPPASIFHATADEILPELPFTSRSVDALAWHPEGRRLAVAEGAGAQSILTSITLGDPQPQLRGTLRLDAGRHWQALSNRNRMIGESDEHQLVTRLFDGSFLEVFFDRPVAPGLWSLDTGGNTLLYVPNSELSPPVLRQRNFATGQNTVLVDSLARVDGCRIFPDSRGFLVWANTSGSGTPHYRVHYFDLPNRHVHKVFEFAGWHGAFIPAPHSSRFATIQHGTSGAQADTLLVCNLESGRREQVPLQNTPVAPPVWLAEDQIMATLERKGDAGDQTFDQLDLRAYTLNDHSSRSLATFLVPHDYVQAELFAAENEIFYLAPAPPCLCQFERQAHACEAILQFSEMQTRIDALTWLGAGERILLHVLDEAGLSNFYIGGPAGIEHYRKNYAATSVSVLPDEHQFVGIMNQRLLQDEIATSQPTALLPDLPCTAVCVHPSGRYLAAFGPPRLTSPRTLAQPLRLIDLQKLAVLDSLVLPYSDTNQMQWLPAENDQENFAGIWRRESLRFPYTEYFYFSFKLHLVSSIYYYYSDSDFTLFPAPNILTLLLDDHILNQEWRIEAP